VDYLCSRDADGDHLLEQGANEDWADTLLRRGKVSYTQAVWYRSLQAAERIFTAVGNTRRAAFCRQEQGLVREAINRVLLDERGFYLNYRDGETVSRRRSLDTALLVAFGVADPATARTVIHTLSRLDGPFGPAVIEPGFAPSATGPSKYPPGQYQNEGIWPWIASYFALALATVGEEERARRVICSCLGPNPHTVHEWIDNLDGEPHHPDFATGAGALAWAITEGGLV
jgi:glycogen debranching enzyme